MVHNEVLTNVEIDLTKVEVIGIPKPKQSKTVVPTTENQSIIPDEGKELTEVIVEGVTSAVDENIKPENIKLGATILGVEGNVAPDKPDQEKTIYPSEEEQIVVGDIGFELAKVIAKPVETESFEITPSTSEQIVKASDGKFIKEVKVGAVEDIEPEITEQATLLNEVQLQVDSLKDVSDETLNINENGEYDVVDYGKVVVKVGDTSVEVSLPEAFGQATTIYHFFVNNDTILISATNTNIGVWVYKISDASLTQAYAKDSYWRNFQMMGDKCLITSNQSSGSPGMLLYNATDNTITQIYNKDRPGSTFTVMNDTKCVISGTNTSFIYLYNASDDSVTQIYGGYSWGTHKKVGDSCLISGGSGSHGPGIVVYNSNDDTATLAYSEHNVHYFNIVGENCLIAGQGGAPGVLLYKASDHTITKIYETGTHWDTLHQVNDTKWLLVSNGGGGAGILAYDATTNTITQVYSTGGYYNIFKSIGNKCLTSHSSVGLLLYDADKNTCIKLKDGYWPYFHAIGNKCLIGSASSSYAGIQLYNANDDSIVQIYDTGYSWQYFQVVGDKCLIGSSASGSSTNGMLVYNINDDTIVRPYTGGYNWRYFQVVGDKCLIGSSNSNSGILLYNSADDTITRKYSYGYYWEYFQVVGDKCLIGSSRDNSNSSANGVLLYKSADNTVTRIFSYNYNYNTFTLNGDSCYIESSDKTKSPYILQYNSTDDTIKIVVYYLEAQ